MYRSGESDAIRTIRKLLKPTKVNMIHRDGNDVPLDAFDRLSSLRERGLSVPVPVLRLSYGRWDRLGTVLAIWDPILELFDPSMFQIARRHCGGELPRLVTTTSEYGQRLLLNGWTSLKTVTVTGEGSLITVGSSWPLLPQAWLHLSGATPNDFMQVQLRTKKGKRLRATVSLNKNRVKSANLDSSAAVQDLLSDCADDEVQICTLRFDAHR